ncbi:hypothetical protein H6758_02050 [Candidatus Nomurabacteria bacterium]|nr:hypothetical protein [Candidatus Nomurabacteria bacterium]
MQLDHSKMGMILAVVLVLTLINSFFIFTNAKQTNAIKRIVEVDSGLVYDSIEGIKVKLSSNDEKIHDQLAALKASTPDGENTAFTKRILKEVYNNTESNICLHFTQTDDGIGRSFIPVFPQYQWSFFAQAFTMDDCGMFREVSGIAFAQENGGFTPPNGDYRISYDPAEMLFTEGKNIVFTKPAGLELSSALIEVGFECQELSADGQVALEPEQCRYWRLDKPVALDKILLLKPFSSISIESSDCVNCG